MANINFDLGFSIDYTLAFDKLKVNTELLTNNIQPLNTNDPININGVLLGNDTTTSANLDVQGTTKSTNLILSNKTTTEEISSSLMFDTFRDISANHFTAGIWSYRMGSTSNSSSDLVFGTGTLLANDEFPPERMRILANGNIGIGVSDPKTKLDILDNNATIRVRDVRTTGISNSSIELMRGADSTFGADPSIDWRIKNQANLTFYTESTALGSFNGTVATMEWDTGNVGIGKTPTEKLDVNGIIKSSGMLIEKNYMIDSSVGTSNWTLRNVTTVNQNFGQLVYGDGVFVALSRGSDFLYSFDGVNWNNSTPPANHEWNNCAYGNGIFVAITVSTTVTNSIMTSTDGINWTLSDTLDGVRKQNIAFGNGVFVITTTIGVVGSASDLVYVSTNGIDWTSNNVPESAKWDAITFGGGLFVAVSKNETSGNSKVMSSPDGVTWTTGTVPNTNLFTDIAYGNGVYVAIVLDFTGSNSQRIIYSSNGRDWVYSAFTTDIYVHSITYGNGMFVIVSRSLGGYNGSSILTSTDGVNWTSTSVPQGDWDSVLYSNGIFVSVGTDVGSSLNSRVMTSGTYFPIDILSINSNLNTSGSEQVMKVTSEGNLYNATGTYGVLSDKRLKENITPATSQIDDLKKLNFVNYNLIGQENNLLGLIAQEVEETCPHLVDSSAKYKTVKSSILYMKCAKALQELVYKVESLEKEIESLKINQ